MIEKNIVDRVPTHAGRVKLTPVSGQTDLFTMTRADDPTVEGTPINKATLDSIIQSRLTGRYYEPTVTKTTLTSASGTANPIPTSWNNTTMTSADNGGYYITASGSRTTSTMPHNAFDGNSSTYWLSSTSTEAWIQLNVPEGLTVFKMKIAFAQSESWTIDGRLQGQGTNGAWFNLATLDQSTGYVLREYTISSPDTYKAYRLKFTASPTREITIYEWQISSWSTATYRNEYRLSNGMPLSWTKGQRITISVPNNAITGVNSNTLNGITVNTILQPLRKYELVYNGSTFDAKEV